MNDNSMFILFAVCFLYFILHHSPFPYALRYYYSIQYKTIRYDTIRRKRNRKSESASVVCMCIPYAYMVYGISHYIFGRRLISLDKR